MTFFNQNIKYEHFIIFDEIMKFDNKMNIQFEKTLRSLTSIKYNNYY